MNLAFGVPWTPAEDAYVREHYEDDRAEAVGAHLGRSLKATQKRAARLGVTVKRPWTAEEDARLAEFWGLHTTRSIARRLGRRTMAVYVRAAAMGLVARERKGMETVSSAALRCGYERRDMVRILKRAGVLRESVSRHVVGHANRPSYQLDPFEVDEAVTAWVKGSSMIGAARARGVSDHKMRRALAVIGVTRPAGLKPREHWRIPEEVYDRALAAVAERRAA